MNFTIENGEGLWLFTSTGTQLDTVAVSAQSGGASQGRLADGSATIVVLLPTPGAASVAKTVTPGQYAITLTAIAGKSYTVRYKDDLLAATWTTLQQVNAPASDTVTTINDTPGVAKRFCQVVTPQQP